MTSPLPPLPPRQSDSHKGDYGRVLVVGGSIGMSGAPALAGMAALRGGAGLVTLAVPASCLPIVASFDPAYMVAPLPEDADGRLTTAAQTRLEPLLAAATTLAVGPGLGRSPEVSQLVAWLYGHVALPAVFDADALNGLAELPHQLAHPGGPRILTPHPGEFRRLVADAALHDRSAMCRRAVQLASETGTVVLLKGHRTLVTDGSRQHENSTGNPGMATGGSGDVLTGLLAALVAQGLAPFEAAQLGAHLHGLAGDLAAAQLGQVSLTAGDLVDYLSAAFRAILPRV